MLFGGIKVNLNYCQEERFIISKAQASWTTSNFPFWIDFMLLQPWEGDQTIFFWLLLSIFLFPETDFFILSVQKGQKTVLEEDTTYLDN